MPKHTVILTAAGLSTRYGGATPKWALPVDGTAMGATATQGLTGDRTVVAAVRMEHWQHYGPSALCELLQVSAVLAIKNTAHQVDTARQALDHFAPGGAVTFRDCDSRFDLPLVDANSVAVADLHTCGPVDAGNKSYVLLRPGTFDLATIAERQVISPLFCCGAYTFASAEVFNAALDRNCTHLSDVVGRALRQGQRFEARVVQRYADWGTGAEYARYTR